MPVTAAEQYGIELMNRARLNPLGEAARYHVGLNDGLAPGTVTSGVKQVLAPQALLDRAAEGHSAWVIATDIFSHYEGTVDPGARMMAEGYVFTGFGGWAWAENMALASLGGALTADSVIDFHQQTLMQSPLHRAAMLGDAYREIGYAQVVGNYTGVTASMVTEDFASRNTISYVTGVAYNDSDHNQFYSIGEGQSGVGFAIHGALDAATTAVEGGYAVLAPQAAAVTVDVGTVGSVILDLTSGNVKLDLVNGTSLWSSGNTTLVSGVNEVGLLGVGALNLTGNAAGNLLHGNAGTNVIRADAGADIVDGAAGNDRIWGGTGNDKLYGGGGTDQISGDAGNDKLFGGDGADRLDGGAGNDAMIGGAGADVFQFVNGSDVDRALDFNAAQGDRLAFDSHLWGGAVLSGAQIVSRYGAVVNGTVEFHFVDTDALVLVHVTSLAGLAAFIDVI